MKLNSTKRFSGSRRRLLGGSAALVAIGVLPALSLNAGVVSAGQRPALWLASQDEGQPHWRPVAAACRQPRVDGPLRIVVRGPRVASGTPVRELSVDAVYRRFPDRPFRLCNGMASAGQGGRVLHVEPSALAALQVCQGGQAARCELTGLLSPFVTPGRYAVLIDSDGDRRDPDWRSLGTTPEGFPIDRRGSRALAAVLVDIRPA